VSTFKDHDTFGKQDPYIKFKYDDEFQQTRVAEDAGTEATFNEDFELRGI
jgi:Ca2+-dependent lipid-binding protein